MKNSIKISGNILTLNGINLTFEQTKEGIKFIHSDLINYEEEVKENIINLIECDNSDAQGIMEIHNDLILTCYRSRMKPEYCALLVDEAAFIAPKTLKEAINNICRINDYYQNEGMLHDDNYTRFINRTLCAVPANDRKEISNFCLDDNG